MSDIKLKIRHAKRSNERSLNLSGLDIIDLPIDIKQLTMLETINLSNNKLTSLRNLEHLPNLREINASNNLIQILNPEVQTMLSLDTLYLFGNPIVNQHQQLAKIENNIAAVKKALDQYFGGSSSLGGIGAPSQSSNIGSGGYNTT